MQLRPYQANAMAEVRNAYRTGKRAPLLCSPTGSGKSAMVRYMLGQTSKRTLILCHRAELLDRISEDLGRTPHGRITAGGKLSDHQIQVGMVQTVARRLDTLPDFGWVISDECHLAMSETWSRTLRHYDKAWHLGMSATPCRLDGRPLGDLFDSIVYGPSVRELTERGYLSPCRVFAPAIDVSSLRKTAGDFSMDDAARLLDRASVTGSAVAEYRARRMGRPAIVFCCTRQHADNVAAEFRMAGIDAANVDGSMSKAERQARIGDFRAGRLPVLTNVDLLTTGFDCPSIEVGIFLRPTQSLALFLQMVGRILRINPGKPDALLLDHVGNVLRHGMPDAEREWTLEGRQKRDAAPPVRQCPECYAAFAPAPKCPACGYVFPVERKREPMQTRDGGLAEITGADVSARTRWLRDAPFKEVMAQAKTRDQLAEVAKARGYDSRWVDNQLRFRAHARYRRMQEWTDRRASA